MKKARLTPDNKIIIKFTGSDFKKILKKIKDLPETDRSFISSTGEWELIYKDEYVQMLRDWNFDIDHQLYAKWKGTRELNWKRINNIWIPECFDEVMRPFQKLTLRLIKFFKFRSMVALPVGSGKSLIAMAVIDWKEEFPVLMITTSSTTHNLKREYYKWIDRGDEIYIPEKIQDLKNYKDKYDIIIVNYEKFNKEITFVDGKPIPSKTLKEFKKNRWRMILTDEAQKYANENSKTYHAIKYLSEGVPYFIGLSATFLNNKTKELFNIANILRPDIFKSRFSFLHRYCDPKTFKIGKKTKKSFDGMSNEAELHDLLKNNMMIRFKPEDIMRELPPVIQTIVPMELDDYSEYEKVDKAFSNHAKTNNGNRKDGLNKMRELMKITYQNKLNCCLKYTDDLLESEDKVLIFTHNKEVMESVMNHYKGVIIKIDGETPMNKRLDIIDQFVEDSKIKALALNLIAGKEGLDGCHTICTHMCFFQHPFTSGGLIQAIGRLHRMNKIGPTKVHHLVGRNTVDEKVLEIIRRKQEMSDAVIDGEFNGSGTVSNMYDELLRVYREEKEV